MIDPISDMITRIKNAAAADKALVSMPYSRLKESVLSVLSKEGFVGSVEKKGKGVIKTLKVELLEGKIKGMERVSKFSARKYSGAKDLKPVRGGSGILILTTPKGVMADKDAKKENVGGEVILKAW